MAQMPPPPYGVAPAGGPPLAKPPVAPIAAPAAPGRVPPPPPGAQVGPTIDENTGEAYAPSFWQQPFVQNAMPFLTSLTFHIGIIVIGYLLFRGIQQATKPLVIDQSVNPQPITDSPEGGVPNPGSGDKNTPAAQNQDDIPPDVAHGVSDQKSDSDALSAAGGGTSDDTSSAIALGANKGGYSSGHGQGNGHGDSSGGGNGDPGAESPFGPPSGGSDGFAPRASFVGLSGNARKIVFVCDATGSMLDKFDYLRDEITKAVTKLSPNQAYSVVFFQDPNNTHPEGMIAWSKELKPALPENKKATIDWVANIAPRGGTDPVPAIKAAMAMHPDLIYFLVDPGDFPDKPGLLALMKQLNADKRTKMSTIAFLNHDAEDEKFLKELADENGGKYRCVEQKDLEQD